MSITTMTVRHPAIRLLGLAAGLALGAAALAQPVTLYRVELTTGETLQNVAIVSQTDDFVTLAHAVLGNVTLARSGIASMTQTGEAEQPPAPAGEPPPAAPNAEPEPEPAPAAEEEESPWSGYADLGLAGTEDNTETLNIRAAACVKRETDASILRFDGKYRLSTDRGDKTANQAILSARHDWLLANSPWGFFAEGVVEIDEFKDYDFRVDLLGGVTYEFIKNDDTSLVGRAGLGAYREFGSAEDEWTPQGVLGLRLEHAFSDRTKFVAYGDYYPSFENVHDFRVISGAQIETALNHDKSLVMKAGVEDRYDNRPGNAEPHDISFFVTLGFSW